MKSRIFNKLLLLFILSFIFIGFCYADEEESSGCLLEDRIKIREMASKVKIGYEPVTLYCTLDNKNDYDSSNDVEDCRVTPADDWNDDPNPSTHIIGYKKYAVALKIYNLPTELYASISNIGKTAQSYYSYDADEEGIISVIIEDASSIKNINVLLIGSGSLCHLYQTRKISVTIPKYNYYSTFPACDILEDYYLCQKYITFDMDGAYFQEHIDSYKEKLSQTKDTNISLEETSATKTGITELFTNHKYVVVIIVIILGVAATLFIVIKMKKVKR